MTLSERNTFFKIGIVFCAVCTFLILAASFFTMPAYSEMDEVSRRPSNFFHTLTNLLLENNYFAVHVSLAVLVIFSLIGMLLIYHFFERTSAPEILYIAIFTISFSFEVIRLILPLHLIYNFPSVYVRFASRVLFFARYFGIFSLFAASICAVGIDMQKTRNVIFLLIIATLSVTISVPIDVLNWNTSMNMVNGFHSVYRLIELAVFFTIMTGFFITSNIRDTKEYAYIAIGIMLALAGRNILLNTDNWIGPLPGIFLLSFGTWFLCSKLHKIHLWL